MFTEVKMILRPFVRIFKVERRTFISLKDVCMDEKTNKILSIGFQRLLAIVPITCEAQCTNHDTVSE